MFKNTLSENWQGVFLKEEKKGLSHDEELVDNE
jgi:hypothetical protein